MVFPDRNISGYPEWYSRIGTGENSVPAERGKPEAAVAKAIGLATVIDGSSEDSLTAGVPKFLVLKARLTNVVQTLAAAGVTEISHSTLNDLRAVSVELDEAEPTGSDGVYFPLE